MGRLDGVPVTIKDLVLAKGWPTRRGSLTVDTDQPWNDDAPAVARLREHGAILLGKTTTPEFGCKGETNSPLTGITRNPWNPLRTTAGSSGGEAAALATGMSPIGLGNDLGGSLRNPANACGIASIRPSAGRVPDAGFVPREDYLMAVQLMNVQGPMARRIDDVRLGLQVLMGAHPRDPWSFTAPLNGPAPNGPIRVAVVTAPPGGTCDPTVSATVRRAADALANAGYEVVDACPPRYEEVAATWARLLMGDFASVLDQLMPLMGEGGKTFLATANAAVAPLTSTTDMSQLLALRHGLGRAWSQFMAEHPLVLTPTWTQIPFEQGFDAATAQGAAATVEMIRPVVAANLLGLPSACVPAGRDTATGMPIGVLLTGQRLREDLCLDAAEVIEAQSGLATPIDPVA